MTELQELIIKKNSNLVMPPAGYRNHVPLAPKIQPEPTLLAAGARRLKEASRSVFSLHERNMEAGSAYQGMLEKD